MARGGRGTQPRPCVTSDVRLIVANQATAVPLRTSHLSASVLLIARRLNTLAESAILVVTIFDRRFIDKTLDSKRPEVIPSTQVFMLTSI